jgi:hypothetical protein
LLFDPNQAFDRFEGAHALGMGSAAQGESEASQQHQAPTDALNQ